MDICIIVNACQTKQGGSWGIIIFGNIVWLAGGWGSPLHNPSSDIPPVCLVFTRARRKVKPLPGEGGDCGNQGDQIGRMFILGSFFKITEVARIFKVLFSTA
jgi:hypothetical protein